MKNKTAPKYIYFFFCFVFLIVYCQYAYIALFPSVYGINMSEFATKRNVVTSILYAKRGTIYDSDLNSLAMDVSSYTVVAYLSPTRTGESVIPYHVIDKEDTSEKLSSILGGETDYYLSLLNQELYQTYLGTTGFNLSETKKKEIEDLNLPGIEFEESYKRYYPNSDFASYILGYARKQNSLTVQVGEKYNLNRVLDTLINDGIVTWSVSDEEIITVSGNGNLTALKPGTTRVDIYENKIYMGYCIVSVVDWVVMSSLEQKIYGELGLESMHEDLLRGTNGYLSYQSDMYGYKIPDTNEERIEAVNGADIYLTIDSNIQRILKYSVIDASDKYDPDWITFTVMDAKTGEILGSESTPSYNPNDLSTIQNYENPLTSFVYEPGSVQKIYTYLCAIEKGVYNGQTTFESGTIEYEDQTINDWNKTGWGTINYDFGFQVSSNTAIDFMTKEYLSSKELYDCFTNYGFGQKTGIDLPREMSGKIEFTSQFDTSAAGFGQGISTTPVQQLQALSIIANGGNMVVPHVIKKIDDNGETTEYGPIITQNIASKESTDYIKTLMYNTVNDTENPNTGSGYKVEGLDVIGKTGTAEVYNSSQGAYSSYEKTYSFSGMFPYDDPEIIVFASMRTPTMGIALSEMVNEGMESIAKYLGIITNDDQIDSHKSFELPFYQNKEVQFAINELKANNINPVVIGTGDIVVSQYPESKTTIISNDKVFLITNSQLVMPDLKGYTMIEAISLLNLMNVNYEITGYGYVIEQSIAQNTILNGENIIIQFKREETESEESEDP